MSRPTPHLDDMAERTTRLIGAAVCMLLGGVYALVAWAAVSGKSATVDEPVSYTHLRIAMKITKLIFIIE